MGQLEDSKEFDTDDGVSQETECQYGIRSVNNAIIDFFVGVLQFVDLLVVDDGWKVVVGLTHNFEVGGRNSKKHRYR